jgi:CheY-like chemotaxis protein
MTSDPQWPLEGNPRKILSTTGPHYSDPLVLIVEDHADTREMLRTLLSIFGCRVIEAEDGERALNVAEQMRPDLILLDMKIPRLDGLAVARLIRSHASLRDVPIVAITGNAAPQFQVETLTAGCNHCLVKPLDFGKLEEVIRGSVHSQGSHSIRW